MTSQGPAQLQNAYQNAITFGERIPRDLPPIETQRRTDICLKADRITDRLNRSLEINKGTFISAEVNRPYTIGTIRKLETFELTPHWSTKPVRILGQEKSRVDAEKLVRMQHKARQFRIMAIRDQMINNGAQVGCGAVVRNLLKSPKP